MKDSPFVHESWSSNRVPELIQNMHRVPIEYQNQFPESVLGIAIYETKGKFKSNF